MTEEHVHQMRYTGHVRIQTTEFEAALINEYHEWDDPEAQRMIRDLLGYSVATRMLPRDDED